MRWYPMLAILIMTGSMFASCKKEKDNKITLSTEKISILAGFDGSVTIKGTAAPYTVQSDNEQIAKATIQKDSLIVITTSSAGTTKILVKDAANRTNTIQVEASSIFGGWRQAGLNGQAVIVTEIESDDAALNETLKQQFQDTATKMGVAHYMLSFEAVTNNGRFMETFGNIQAREGTYTNTPATRQIVLKINGAEEIYVIKRYDGGGYVITRDRTAHYQNLYPGKGIRKVIFGLVMGRVIYYG